MIEKETLVELYVNKGLTQKEIGEIVGYSVGSVKAYIKKYNLHKKRTFQDVSKIIKKYNKQAKLVSYTSSTEPCEIQCSCGNIFQRYLTVIKRNETCICLDCSGWRGAGRGYSHEEVTVYLNQYHCELLSEYKDVKTKMNIKCSCGNVYQQSFETFKQGNNHGCTICFHKKNHEEQRFTNEEVRKIIEEAGCSWLSGDYKGLKSKLGISCFKCGDEQAVALDKFIYQHKINCNNCSSNRSTFELYTSKLLTDLNIEFMMDKHLEGAYGIKKGRLRFDFIVLQNGIPDKIIEVDGSQHYKNGGNKNYFNCKQAFEDRIANDRLKEEYCRKHKLPLLRIPYTMFRSKKKKDLLETELLSFIYERKDVKTKIA